MIKKLGGKQCGICGYINCNEKIRNDYIIKKMLKETNKYCSADSNIYIDTNIALASYNPSIVDLLNDCKPLSLEYNSNKYTITYNGQLYNRNQLKDELINLGFSLNTNSDAEIVLLLYIIYKEKCLDKLNGVYSFAIHSKNENLLFTARDRLGVKPLYYTITNNTFIFASEIKTILKHPYVKAKIGEKEIMELIGLGPAHTPGNTYFKDIHELKAGHFATFSDINFNTYCYWDLKTDNFEDDVYTAISRTKELVSNSLKEQLIADVPVCCMLSGGLDSSVLTTLAKQENSCLSTFSIDFIGNDTAFESNSYQPTQDSEYVKIMSEYLKTNHKTIYFKNEDLYNLLKDSMIARDMPGMADIDASMYAFCKSISENGFKIAISGECSDEIFGGYPWYYREKLVNYDSFPWALSDNIRNNLIKKDLCKNYNIKEYIKESYDNTLKNVELNSSNDFENKFRKTNYLTIKWFMNTLIERTDRTSTATGLNVRVPFADYRLFEYIYNVPAKYKLGLVHNTEPVEKYLLRKAFESELPKDVVYRKKSPFPKTYGNDYLSLVKNEIQNILNDESSPLNQIIDKNYIQKILESDGSILTENWFGQLMTYPQLLAYLIQINMWLKEYDINIEIS